MSRLLIVTNFYPPRAVGGAEVVAHRHALLLKQRGWAVAVLAGVLPSKDFPPGTIHFHQVDGVEVTLIALRSLDPDDNFRWPLADNVLRACIGASRPDWIHIHNAAGLGVDLIAIAHDAGIRVAVTLHDNWGYCFKATRLRNDGSLCLDTDECHLCKPDIRAGAIRLPIRLRKDYVASRLQEADMLISPSADLAARYVEDGFQPESIIVQSNGIDLDHIPARVRRHHGPVKFLCGAYMAEHKGIPVLLDALGHLHSEPSLEERWSITIAGHGHLSGMVEERIRTQGWTNVSFVGRRPREEMLGLVFASDVVVLPSSWPENEPVILLEAIASGAALLASRLGGNTELVREGQTGLLFTPSDARDLAAGMQRMIQEPGLLGQFSQANLTIREKLDEKLTVGRLHDLFLQQGQRHTPGLPLLICAGKPNLQIVVMVSLFAKLIPNVRLIWHEWASAADWARARGFWHWSKPTIIDLEPAIKRGISIVAPDAPVMQILQAPSGPSTYPYSDMRAFWSITKRLCQRGDSDVGQVPSLARFLVQLHDTSHFAAAPAE